MLDANAKLPAVDGSQLTNISGNSTSFRNLFINGSLAIQQRGTSFSGSPFTGAYTADRWRFDRSGSGATSIAISADTNYGGAYKATITAAMAAGEIADFKQRIPSDRTVGLSGNAVTVSFWAALAPSTGSTAFSVVLTYPTATDNYTSETLISSTAVTLTTTPTLYTVTFTGLPAGVANGLSVAFRMGQSGATGSPALSLGSLQIEKGTVATSFERLPIGQELFLSQRFYNFIGPVSLFANSGSFAGFSFSYPTMRTIPTITTSGWLSVCAQSVSQSVFSGILNPQGPLTTSASFTASAEL